MFNISNESSFAKTRKLLKNKKRYVLTDSSDQLSMYFMDSIWIQNNISVIVWVYTLSETYKTRIYLVH